MAFGLSPSIDKNIVINMNYKTCGWQRMLALCHVLSERSGAVFLLMLLIVFTAKLILVGGNEIISIPNDSVNFVRQAQDYLHEIGGPMGYSYWLALTKLSGLPQRISIELLYLSCALAAALSLNRLVGRTIVLFTFFLLAFLPATFFLFDNALSDGFYACLTLLGLTLSIGALIDRTHKGWIYWGSLILLSVVFGMMLISRNEDYLVVGWIAWLCICSFFIQQRQTSLRHASANSFAVFAILIFGTFAVPSGVSAYHWVSKGVYARTLPTLSSHMTLLRNLASIDTGVAATLRIPITKVARDIAYGVSPSLRRVQEVVEDPGNMYQVASANSGLPAGEVGAGWVWHVFNDAVLKVIPKKSLRDLDDFYHAANSELELAFQRDEIKRRFVVHPLIGGSIGEILLDLPKGLIRIFQRSFQSTTFVADQGFEKELFDVVCLRRSALVYMSGYSGLVQGWAFAELSGGSILSAKIGVYEGAMGVSSALWFNTERFARPDVESAFAVEGRRHLDLYGFRMQLPLTKGDQIVVRYFLSDGSFITSPPLVANKVSRVKQVGIERFLIQGVDAVGRVGQAGVSNGRKSLQTAFIALFAGPFRYLFTVLIMLAVPLKLISSLKGKVAPVDVTMFMVLGLIAGILLQRLLFYALLDVAAWDVEIRYLVSAAVLLPLIFALSAAYLFNVRKTRLANEAS